MACLSARVLYMLYVLCVLTCFMCSRAWSVLRALVLGMLHEMACLACFKKLACFITWSSWRTSCHGLPGVIPKMTCLKAWTWFLDMFDQRALVNCRLWMWSDILLDGRKLLNLPYNLCLSSKFGISCFNLNFYTYS